MLINAYTNFVMSSGNSIMTIIERENEAFVEKKKYPTQTSQTDQV